MDFYNTKGGRQFIDGTMPQLVRNVAALNETMKTAFLTDDGANEKGNKLYVYVYDRLKEWDRQQHSVGAVDGDEATSVLRKILRELRGLGFHRGAEPSNT